MLNLTIPKLDCQRDLLRQYKVRMQVTMEKSSPRKFTREELVAKLKEKDSNSKETKRVKLHKKAENHMENISLAVQLKVARWMKKMDKEDLEFQRMKSNLAGTRKDGLHNQKEVLESIRKRKQIEREEEQQDKDKLEVLKREFAKKILVFPCTIEMNTEKIAAEWLEDASLPPKKKKFSAQIVPVESDKTFDKQTQVSPIAKYTPPVPIEAQGLAKSKVQKAPNYQILTTGILSPEAKDLNNCLSNKGSQTIAYKPLTLSYGSIDLVTESQTVAAPKKLIMAVPAVKDHLSVSTAAFSVAKTLSSVSQKKMVLLEGLVPHPRKKDRAKLTKSALKKAKDFSQQRPKWN